MNGLDLLKVGSTIKIKIKRDEKGVQIRVDLFKNKI